MTLPEAIAEVRRVGSLTLESGKLKVRFPDTDRSRLAPALAVLRANRDGAIEQISTEPAQAEPSRPTLAGLDPEAPGIPFAQWRAQQLNRLFLEHGRAIPHEASCITANTVADKLFRAKKPPPDSDGGSCSLCRGPLGDQPGTGYFVPPDNLNKRLGKPANSYVEVTLCYTCFARPDREAAMMNAFTKENEGRLRC